MLGNLFYIIIEGKVRVDLPTEKYKIELKKSRRRKRGQSIKRNIAGDDDKERLDELIEEEPNYINVATLEAGQSFGEMALIRNQPRLASIVCEEDCHFATLDKYHFEKVLSKTHPDFLRTTLAYVRIEKT